MLRSALLSSILFLAAQSACAQDAAADLRRAQQQIEQMNQQLQQQLELQQLRIDTERIRAENRQLDADIKSREQAASDKAAREKQQAAAADKASEEAEELRMQVHMAGVRTADNAYVFLAVLLCFAFAGLSIRRHHKEGSMRYEQKFGTVLVVVSVIGTIFALMISRYWSPQLDVLQNVMLTLRIAFFEEEGQSLSLYAKNYEVDLPTKYVLLGFLVIAAYGFLSYLGITPTFGKKQAHSLDEVEVVK